MTTISDPIAEGDTAVIHVRFADRSIDLPLAHLDLSIASSDRQIKRAVAGHLEVPAAKLDEYAVDRYPNGNVTIRPQAVFE